MAQRRRRTLSLAVLGLFQSLPFASQVGPHREPAPDSSVPSSQAQAQAQAQEECSIFATSREQCDPAVLESFLPHDVTAAIAKNGKHPEPEIGLLDDMLSALGVLQEEYYEVWLGSWPDGIDWTRAVVGTHVSGSIRTLSESLASVKFDDKNRVLDWKLKSNLIDSYFTHIIGYYFGEDDFSIRHEAFDDMLWVVLGWLEAVQFLNTHTGLHFTPDSQATAAGTAAAAGLRTDGSTSPPQVLDVMSNQTYHGNSWIPAFAHRARIFWDLASQGWDTELCDGGMVWNPRLLPYKNAITNELFIAASIAMYLHFPGDDIESPFSSQKSRGTRDVGGGSGSTRDPKYLKAAIDGYRWLAASNMTDAQGLYTDGFHISGLRDSGSNNTRCDEREDTVLTYNQGVLLTGLRGLWEATGAPSYLADGHALIQRVIRATGWDLCTGRPFVEDNDDDGTAGPHPHPHTYPRPRPLPRWQGLGRAGILEDPCDASAVCNQDATTFKGIYFHHLAAFCAPLPPVAGAAGKNEQGMKSGSEVRITMEKAKEEEAFNATRESHDDACATYRGWLAHNAKAALATRDARGRFGQWWTAGLLFRNHSAAAAAWPTMADDGVPRDLHANSSDYTLWRGPYDFGLIDHEDGDGVGGPAVAFPDNDYGDDGAAGGQQKPLRSSSDKGRGDEPVERRRGVAPAPAPAPVAGRGDPNERGRGRTVETQSGGVALLRAYWKIGRPI
ncbi:hypothetical protein SLS62_000306 [Diatrype stigma]|uniref:Glycosyl hydrolase n=1 Tax=Diatrype stigma TaxID=117547 RepID=A0AAN9VD33_9PEZI